MTAIHSRGAATERSPRRKPWVERGKRISPNGAKDHVHDTLPQSRRFSIPHTRLKRPSPCQYNEIPC
jgi:hypothetical protein